MGFKAAVTSIRYTSKFSRGFGTVRTVPIWKIEIFLFEAQNNTGKNFKKKPLLLTVFSTLKLFGRRDAVVGRYYFSFCCCCMSVFRPKAFKLLDRERKAGFLGFMIENLIFFGYC